MYEMLRTAFDGNGQPMRLTVTVYPADGNQFHLDIGQVPVSNRMYRQIAEDLREQIVSGEPQINGRKSSQAGRPAGLAVGVRKPVFRSSSEVGQDVRRAAVG